MKKLLLAALLFLPSIGRAADSSDYFHPRFRLLYRQEGSALKRPPLGWQLFHAPSEKYRIQLAEMEQAGYRWVSFPYIQESLLGGLFLLLSALSGTRSAARLRRK